MKQRREYAKVIITREREKKEGKSNERDRFANHVENKRHQTKLYVVCAGSTTLVNRIKKIKAKRRNEE